MLSESRKVLEEVFDQLTNVWCRVGLSPDEQKDIGARWAHEKLKPLAAAFLNKQLSEAGQLSHQNVETLNNIHSLAKRLKVNLSHFNTAFSDYQNVYELKDEELLAPYPPPSSSDSEIRGGITTTGELSNEVPPRDLKAVAHVLQTQERNLKDLATDRLGILELLIQKRTPVPFKMTMEDEEPPTNGSSTHTAAGACANPPNHHEQESTASTLRVTQSTPSHSTRLTGSSLGKPSSGAASTATSSASTVSYTHNNIAFNHKQQELMATGGEVADIARLGFKQDLSATRIMGEAKETIKKLNELHRACRAQIQEKQKDIDSLWTELGTSDEEKLIFHDDIEKIQAQIEEGLVPELSNSPPRDRRSTARPSGDGRTSQGAVAGPGPRPSTTRRLSTTAEKAQEAMEESGIYENLTALPPIVQEALNCPSPEPLLQYIDGTYSRLMKQVYQSINGQLISSLEQHRNNNQELFRLTQDNQYTVEMDVDVFLLTSPRPVTPLQHVERRREALGEVKSQLDLSQMRLGHLRELFPLMRRREEIMSQKEELESSQVATQLCDRRVNMAKVLLEQEKARKILKQELPRIEGRVREICRNWLKADPNPVLIRGKQLQEILESVPEEQPHLTKTQMAMRGTTTNATTSSNGNRGAHHNPHNGGGVRTGAGGAGGGSRPLANHTDPNLANTPKGKAPNQGGGGASSNRGRSRQPAPFTTSTAKPSSMTGGPRGRSISTSPIPTAARIRKNTTSTSPVPRKL